MCYVFDIRSMKYTKYLAAMVQAQGAPQFTAEQFKTVMNLVHIEGRLVALEKLRKEAAKTNEPHRFDLDYFTEEKRRHEITKDVDPKIYFGGLLSQR